MSHFPLSSHLLLDRVYSTLLQIPQLWKTRNDKFIIVFCWNAGYLACARCAGSGSIVGMENGGTTAALASSSSTERCPNCAGATKVLNLARSLS